MVDPDGDVASHPASVRRSWPCRTPPRSPPSWAPTRACSCSPVPAFRPTPASPTTAAPTAPAGSRRCSMASSSARRRRGSGYWAAVFIGWAASLAPSPTPLTAPWPDLQARGARTPVITQNVDGLHQAAGSRDVIELHGSARRGGLPHLRRPVRPRPAAGPDVEANHGFDRLASGEAPDGSRVSSQIRPDGDIVLADDLVAGFHLPRCTVCGGDALKPDVVFFGGSVPRERVDACYTLTDAAPALLVLGSSLAVMSGLRFVRHAAKRGIPVMAVTRGPTRGDDLMTLRVDASLAPTLGEVLRAGVAA